MAENVVVVNAENFEEEVLKSEKPVVVDFWGPRCVPCLGLMPVVEELAAEYKDIKFCKLNTAENRRLTVELKVMALPTFLFYKNGQVVDQISGNVTRDAIVEKISSLG